MSREGGSSNDEARAFKLKGTMPALTMLHLLTGDVDAIERQLVEHIGQMPQFFQNAPVMVDLQQLGDTPIDLAELARKLRAHSLVPVAIRNPTDAQRERAVAAGWGVLQTMLVRPQAPSARPLASSSPEPTETAARGPDSGGTPDGPFAPGLTVRQPVRSGQIAHSISGDLVVIGAVSSGAELIADGNIHVYGPLRGRAIAGVHDNPEASIFCLCLEAELLSIAGVTVTSDEIPKDLWGKPARVQLADDRLVVTKIDAAPTCR